MKNIHYGKVLKKEIEDKGYSTRVIAEKLNITTYLLKVRLKDGEFTLSQMDTLYNNRYINQS